jgi:hypothetical protein
MSRILPNLLAKPAKRAFAACDRLAVDAIEIFEITPADVPLFQEWRCGWYWWSYANPGEDSIAR